MKTISLCTFGKNEENCLGYMIESVKDYIDEIVYIDTGSTDASIDIAKSYNARIYEIGFSDFGKIRTITSHLSRCDYTLMLDCDETLENGNLLEFLTSIEKNDAYAFPRKRWANLEKTKQLEIEAFPDLQVRLFKNNINYSWKRELHEFFDGATVTHVLDGPIIHHFHDVFKSPERLKERQKLYTRLSEKAGVSVEGGKVL
jgi:glycosyltransferase involved in cell wall biosynthesis